ncbi:SCO-spondin-like isoform X2 [Sycon ciliatum]|uniref:SCO-spondin-like isoform X2 n=1 Tax=Sycon ciliatum TaxID=27933 RepID=UPI0031F7017B
MDSLTGDSARHQRPTEMPGQVQIQVAATGQLFPVRHILYVLLTAFLASAQGIEEDRNQRIPGDRQYSEHDAEGTHILGLDDLHAWSTWSSWAACQQVCGGYTRRSRECDSVWAPASESPHGSTCQGPKTEYKPCRACTTDWSACSSSCGSGVRQRMLDGNNVTEHCTEQPCPYWRPWSKWSWCTATCGVSVRHRTRSCSEPGRCRGDTFHIEQCRRPACADRDGVQQFSPWSEWSACTANASLAAGFSFRSRQCQVLASGCIGKRVEYKRCYWPHEWTAWSECSVSCGGGQRHRTLICFDLLSVGPCPEQDKVETETCNLHACPVHGGWSAWSNWTGCSVSCGSVGFQERRRACNSPEPDALGNDCSGQSNELRLCRPPECPIDGGFSNWTEPTPCTQSCGTGLQVQLRTCTNPMPQHGGLECEGSLARILPCNTHHCPVAGGFGPWTHWASCSATCGGGVQYRRRDCDSPAPLHGGENCQGEFNQSQPCGHAPCPIDGVYGNWSAVSTCNAPCGNGTSYRNRSCDSPSPQYGGKGCVGPAVEVFDCFLRHCPIDGGFGNWSKWSVCSEDCGPGVENRTRECDNPIPQYGGLPCLGHTMQSQSCEVKPCPIDGRWSVWSNWTNCSQWCGTGYQERFRACNNPAPQFGGKPCSGLNIDNQTCFLRHCPIDGGFGNWSKWSVCSKDCGPGIENRTRECDTPIPQYGGLSCLGHTMQSQPCEVKPCPIDGQWSVWSSWTNCSQWCGTGYQERFRACNNPAPQFGGQPCPGLNIDNQTCFLRHCPIDGGFGNWSKWSVCSEDCGPGIENRTRECDTPIPQYGGLPCLGHTMQSQPCEVKPCPIDGQWNVWSDWTNCSEWCGTGYQERFRACDSPVPQFGGQPCPGLNIDNRTCILRLCPIDGGFGEWSPWSSCSEQCGSGVENRTRECDNPIPQYGGLPCLGHTMQSQSCEVRPCPIDGRWSVWSNWTNCSQWCGTGYQERFRACDNPAPQFGGQSCPGLNIDNQTCILRPCPIDGGFGEWSPWSSCSEQCGPGIETRTRRCNSPPPKHDGKPCEGHRTDSQSCQIVPCPVDGQWSLWSKWTNCSRWCGTGFQERFRDCDSPPPQFGGEICPGPSVDNQTCLLRHCPVDGVFGEWSIWSVCSKECGPGVRNRTRSCDNPQPQHDGKPCSGENAENESCEIVPCPIDGAWAAWSEWANCSQWCGTGFQERFRNCNSPAPQFGGRTCAGSSVDSQTCFLRHCPIDGGFGNWSMWSQCSEECGPGTQDRMRECNAPVPQYDGASCSGNHMQTQGCQDRPCPIDGQWAAWSGWTNCSEWCGVGLQDRYRECDAPPPQHSGLPCSGAGSANRSCYVRPCPIDGHFGSWGRWLPCSTTCGSGLRERHRHCNSPEPQFGGKPCTGSPISRQSCDQGPCPINGNFSEWMPWSQCSASCSAGVRTRRRLCDNPAPQFNGWHCQGIDRQQEGCTVVEHCPVDGRFGDWTAWEACSVSCEQGQTHRRRECNAPRPSHGGLSCSGASTQTRTCYQGYCPIDGVFGSWSDWSVCSRTCGGGMQARSRLCDSPPPLFGGKECTGENFERQDCNQQPCPIDGEFAEWTMWSPCSATCNTGQRNRQRSCTNPRPQHNGRFCIGMARHSEACFIRVCPIDGKFGNWMDWGACQGMCGKGNWTRRRLCDNPEPMFGGADCQGESHETQECNLTTLCPVDGMWSDWGGWNHCSKSCGTGEQRRVRACNNPVPEHGGQRCAGRLAQTRACFQQNCPVDGNWTRWSEWSDCSRTCDGGVRARSRSCTQPEPLYGGNQCDGDAAELEQCQQSPCPVDGEYTEWSTWTECTKSCGGGERMRSRACTDPEPQHGGQGCDRLGANAEQQPCNVDSCPVDGVWEPWSAWTDCPVTCGGGIQTRNRSCVPPLHNGKPCTGNIREVKTCASMQCPNGCELISCYPGVKCTTIPGLAHIGICGDCPVGYEGDGLNCININECEEAQPCADDTLCQDTDGGFRCLPCTSLGLYVGESRVGSGLADARNPSSKQICTDVDECESGIHDCYALCENTPGSFICSPCPAGYVGRSGRGCRLVDACEANLHNCDIKSNYCVPKGGYAFTCECVEIGYLKYNEFCFRDEDLDGVPNIANRSCHGVDEWRCRTDNCPQVPNPLQKDTDRDGEGDACDKDSDNDGTDDLLDNCRQKANPSQRDRDNDGVGDDCDNCASTYNPDQGDLFPGDEGNVCEHDADGDGRPNSRDNCWLVVNRFQEDQDGDGVGDHCDNCDRQINPDQADQDQDGTGDACDTGEDRDRDGIQDDKDVCPCTPNAAQADHDRGYGVRDRVNDACDQDDDNDLIPDSEDNCILVPNPLQTTSRYKASARHVTMTTMATGHLMKRMFVHTTRSFGKLTSSSTAALHWKNRPLQHITSPTGNWSLRGSGRRHGQVTRQSLSVDLPLTM